MSFSDLWSEGKDTSDQPKSKTQGTVPYLIRQANLGVADTLGLPVDTSRNLLNLGIAGGGVLSGTTPSLLNPGILSSEWIASKLPGEDLPPPSDTGTKMAGEVARFMGANMVPAFGFASQAARHIPALIMNTILGGTAGAVGAISKEAVGPESPYAPVAELAGQVVGAKLPGVYSALSPTVNAVRLLKGGAKSEIGTAVNTTADRMVANKIASEFEKNPQAATALSEASRLESDVPGLRYRVGQATNLPSLIDMERRVAQSNPELLNQRQAQDAGQRAAIERVAGERLPILGENLASEVEASQRARQAITAPIEEVNAQRLGQTLKGERITLKRVYDRIASEKFSAPVAEAERLGVTIKPEGIVSEIDKMMANPLLKYDASNAPSVASRIASLHAPETSAPSAILGPTGAPAIPGETATKPISFADLKGMREAVNQDIAREKTSNAPEARQRLRALVGVQSAIDEAATQAPASVRNLYSDATNWYKSTYAPKFLKGVNLTQSGRTITGEAKILDERLAGQYFKPLGTSAMDRFLTLYGDSPKAMSGMRDNILDTYRREVAPDGIIDPLKHDKFVSNTRYGPVLDKTPEIKSQLSSMRDASVSLGEREAALAKAKTVLDKSQLDNLRYDAADKEGLDPAKISKLLKTPGYEQSIADAYGKETAINHVENLRKIARAGEIADRGGEVKSAAQGLEPVTMREKLGFTARTVFSLYRGIITGRTSPQDMAVALGTQSGTHLFQKALVSAEQRAMSDPETARLLVQAQQQPITTAEGKSLLRQILSKGGFFGIGATKGPSAITRVLPAIAAEQGKE